MRWLCNYSKMMRGHFILKLINSIETLPQTRADKRGPGHCDIYLCGVLSSVALMGASGAGKSTLLNGAYTLLCAFCCTLRKKGCFNNKTSSCLANIPVWQVDRARVAHSSTCMLACRGHYSLISTLACMWSCRKYLSFFPGCAQF